MTDLKICVERIVRPVQASINRKLNMREELYGHLQGAYEEEVEQLKDQDDAVATALQRLGSTDELMQNLNASVPWFDHGFRLFEPAWRNRLGLRTVISCIMWSALLLVVFMVLFHFSLSGQLVMGAEQGIVLVLHIAIFGTFYGIAGFSHGVLGFPRSSFWACVCSLTFFCCVVGAAIAVIPDSRALFVAVYAVVITATIAFASIAFAKQVRRFEEALRRTKEWESLTLDVC